MTQVVQKTSIFQHLVRFIIALSVLASGIGSMVYCVATKPKPSKVDREDLGTLVEIQSVEATTQRVRVPANGQVLPSQQIALSPEVGGRVVWMNKGLVPGGRFSTGDKIVRIDAREYSLALQQQLAQVDRASTELTVERSRKQIAEREWALMGKGKPADALALRDPQLKTAEAALKAARSGVSRAKLSVGKTLLKAPFNAMVYQKNVDLGQLVGPATPLATLVGTDSFWVRVSIPVDRLRWIQVPGVGGAAPDGGSDVEISQKIGDERICRKGKVVRLLSDLDPMGRMARVLVEIPDPLRLSGETTSSCTDEEAVESQLPLLINSYVTVEIDGAEIADTIKLPREAIRGGDRVYVMTDEGTLDIRKVKLVWRRRDSVLVGSGLSSGDKVVLTPISVATQGMKLRTAKPGKGDGTATGSKAGKGDSSAAAAADIPVRKSNSDKADKKDTASGGAGTAGDGATKVANPSR